MYSVVKQYCSNFRVITAIFWVSEFFGCLRYLSYLLLTVTPCNERKFTGLDVVRIVGEVHGTRRLEHLQQYTCNNERKFTALGVVRMVGGVHGTRRLEDLQQYTCNNERKFTGLGVVRIVGQVHGTR